jgi:hypothetical protein
MAISTFSPRNSRTLAATCSGPAAAARLLLQQPHQVRIAHRRQWMVLHAGFIEQHVIDEQVTTIDGSPVLRESRTGDREICPECGHQRVGPPDAFLADRTEPREQG